MAIIANCELITVVVVGAIVLDEKLTPTSALGGGLTLAASCCMVGAQATAGSNRRKVSRRGWLTPRRFTVRRETVFILNSLRPAH